MDTLIIIGSHSYDMINRLTIHPLVLVDRPSFFTMRSTHASPQTCCSNECLSSTEKSQKIIWSSWCYGRQANKTWLNFKFSDIFFTVIFLTSLYDKWLPCLNSIHYTFTKSHMTQQLLFSLRLAWRCFSTSLAIYIKKFLFIHFSYYCNTVIATRRLGLLK